MTNHFLGVRKETLGSQNLPMGVKLFAPGNETTIETIVYWYSRHS